MDDTTFVKMICIYIICYHQANVTQEQPAIQIWEYVVPLDQYNLRIPGHAH